MTVSSSPLGTDLGPPAAASSQTAVVVAGDEETRVLLRGLLRLHHFRIVGESEGSTGGAQLIASVHPTLLIVDANLAEGSCSRLIQETRSVAPSTRVVLVLPAARPGPAAGSPVPDATLPRPFRIHQFAEAISPSGAGDLPRPPTALQR